MELKAIIEIPMASKYKFEVNKENGKLKLDRVLNQRIPFNYGYLENTLADDGDPTDIFLISEDPIPSLTEVNVQVFGIIKCVDNGVQDDKLLAHIVGDSIQPGFGVSLIANYLSTYKQGFFVQEILGLEEAISSYENDSKRFKDRSRKADSQADIAHQAEPH